ncbi:MAG: excisionase family DNA-binding protein [Mycobacteriales bacterium]
MAARTAPPLSARISIEEAAESRGVSTRTIRRLIADGRLPAYRFGPRLIRLDPADLELVDRRIPAAGAGVA